MVQKPKDPWGGFDTLTEETGEADPWAGFDSIASPEPGSQVATKPHARRVAPASDPGLAEHVTSKAVGGFSGITEAGIGMLGRLREKGIEAAGGSKLARGLLGGPAGLLYDALPKLAPDEAKAELQGDLSLQEDPSLQESFWASQVPEAMGGSAAGLAFAAPMAALAPAVGLGATGAALASGAASGALTNAGTAYDQTLAKTGDESKAWEAAGWGGLIGTTEAVDTLVAGVGSKALRPLVKGGLGKALSSVDGKLGGLLKEAIFGSAMEGLQEGSQQVLSEVVDKHLTGEEKDFVRIFLEAAKIGGTIGALFGVGGQALRAGQSARQGEAKPPAETPLGERATEISSEISPKETGKIAETPGEPAMAPVEAKPEQAAAAPTANAVPEMAAEASTVAGLSGLELSRGEAAAAAPELGKPPKERAPLGEAEIARLNDLTRPEFDAEAKARYPELPPERAVYRLEKETGEVNPVTEMNLSTENTIAERMHEVPGLSRKEAEARVREENVASIERDAEGFREERRRVADRSKNPLSPKEIAERRFTEEDKRIASEAPPLTEAEFKAGSVLRGDEFNAAAEARYPGLSPLKARIQFGKDTAPPKRPSTLTPEQIAEYEAGGEPTGVRGGGEAKAGEAGEFQRAGSTVDGRTVLKNVPNTESISASLGDNYEELPGVREVPLSEFGETSPKKMFYAVNDIKHSERLAERIKASGEIEPLIVVIDKNGPYLLEGLHRLGALNLLGAKSFPAVVVHDTSPDMGVGADKPEGPSIKGFLKEEAGGQRNPLLPRRAVAKPPDGGPPGFDVPERTRADAAYEVIVNDLERIVQVEKAAPNKAKGPETVEETLSLFPGRKFGEGEKIDRQLVKPLTKLFKEIKPDAASDYLMALHVPKAMESVADRGGKSVGMDPAEAAKIVKAAESGPNAVAFKRLREWNRAANKKALDILESGFLISKETRTDWETRFGPDFVHLKSVPDPMAEEFFGGPAGFNVTGPESKKRMGRESKAGNPIAFRLMSLQEVISRKERNRIGNTLASLVEQNPKAELWRLESDRNKVRDGEEALSYKANGEQRFIVTKDKGLANAFKRIQDPEPGAVALIDPALTFLHNVIIKWNPVFPLYNVPKDVGSAALKQMIRGDGKAAMAVLKHSIPAAKGAYEAIRTEGAGGKWGERYRQLRDAGGLVGWNQQLGFEEQVKSFEKATTRQSKAVAFGQLMDDLNRAGEVGTRLATFDALVKSGMPVPRAAMEARRVTADFARRGRWAPVYRRLYMFSGANVQGTAELARAIKQNPGRAATVLGSLVGAGYAMAMLSQLTGDPGELEKLTEDEKARFFGVMIGKKRYGIPAAYGFNVFPYLGWKLADMANGQDKSKALGQALAAGVDSFSPLPRGANFGQMVTPTLGRPITEIGQNKDFAGRPIMPERSPFEKAPPPASERFFKSVSGLSRGISKGLAQTGIEVSPEILDHLAKAATGGLGAAAGRTLDNTRKVIVGDTEDMRIQDFPIAGEVARPFIREAHPAAENSLMWNTVKKVQRIEAEIKRDIKAGGEKEDAARERMKEPEVKAAIKSAAAFKVFDRHLDALRKARDEADSDDKKAKIEDKIKEVQKRFLDLARRHGVRIEME